MLEILCLYNKSNNNFDLDLAPTDSAAELPSFKFPRPGPEDSVNLSPLATLFFSRWKKELAHFQLLNKQLLQHSFSPDQLLSVRLHIYMQQLQNPKK